MHTMDVTHYHALSTATCVEEVLRATRSYLATFSRAELARLPDGCRPRGVRSTSDIERWADKLTHESSRALVMYDDERRLDSLVSHFLIASVRIRQLSTAHA